MTIDVLQHFGKDPKLNKLIGDDYMFVEYNCPLDVENFKLWTETPLLNYVISGKKDWTALEGTYTITQGEALFVKQGVYNTKQYFEDDYCVILFFITEDFIRRFMKIHEHIPTVDTTEVSKNQIFPVDVGDSLNALFLSVFNYMNQDGDIPKALVEMKFNELLYNLILNPRNKDLITYFRSLQQVEKSNLDTVMMKNFHCDLKLEEFARLTGRSLSTFKRDFKAYYNETPGRWLNNKRLEYAKTLLANHELNINDVCFESGFKNSSHFNSRFKEKYRLPPNQYRKQALDQ